MFALRNVPLHIQAVFAYTVAFMPVMLASIWDRNWGAVFILQLAPLTIKVMVYRRPSAAQKSGSTSCTWSR